MHYGLKTVLIGAAFVSAASVHAEVVRTSENGFITKDEAVVDASPTQTWLALTNPADWWNSQHTWSADASNLRLTPQAGGCFCEKIPEVSEPDRFTLEGSVEHMRVIQAYPNSALRMIGALGPLQSEPVTGVLTIALTEVDLPEGSGRKGTRIVWEYNVGGSMRYEIPVISKAVDGVMSEQLAGLAEKLGRVELPEEQAAEADGSVEPDLEAAEDGADEGEGSGGSKPEDADAAPEDEAEAIEPEATLEQAQEDGEPSPDQGLTVDEAFDDFGDFDPDKVTVTSEGEPDGDAAVEEEGKEPDQAPPAAAV
ncbi:MAG: SRPBCC family protein [Pseudomonadota bacterium]